MSHIEANPDELEIAARTHRDQADQLAKAGSANPSRSAVLLQFYGVESGMKAKYLRAHLGRTTRDIPEGSFGVNGHDLVEGLKTLRAPAIVGGRPPTLHRRSTGQQIPIARSHEALRYGVDLRPSDRDTLNAWLTKLLAWLQSEGSA